MIRLENLSDAQLQAISREFYEAFKNNPFASLFGDGVKQRKKAFLRYARIMVRAAHRGRALYATSSKREGVIILFTEQELKQLPLTVKWQTIKEFLLLPLGPGLRLLKMSVLLGKVHLKADRLMELNTLYVQPDYRGQGFMRQLMTFCIEKSQQEKCQLILDTDTTHNVLRYRHYGFEVYDTQLISRQLTFNHMCYVNDSDL